MTSPGRASAKLVGREGGAGAGSKAGTRCPSLQDHAEWGRHAPLQNLQELGSTPTPLCGSVKAWPAARRLASPPSFPPTDGSSLHCGSQPAHRPNQLWRGLGTSLFCGVVYFFLGALEMLMFSQVPSSGTSPDPCWLASRAGRPGSGRQRQVSHFLGPQASLWMGLGV